MILIDRDKLLNTIPSEEAVARMAVMSAPTVDAVPVSYIQQRIDHLQDIADFALDSNGGYIESANSSLYELKLILSMWKKEQSDTPD